MNDLGNNVYSFEIPLPNNPLKWLNCYVIKKQPGGRNLLIDTGFNMPECKEALAAGMEELGLSCEETDVFVTHLHSDHSGNVNDLAAKGCRILMGEDDKQRLMGNPPTRLHERGIAMGFPEDVLVEVLENMPATKYAPKPFESVPIYAGDVLEYGGKKLECILTPGHTPNHICLYDRENKTIFCGDHVLFDITPNIVSWVNMEDSLGKYLDSLRKVKELDVEIAYPSHRTTGDKTFYQRIDEIILHHEARLDETLEMVRQNPDATAHDIAALVKWKIRARNWDEFPPGQKWFAVGECLAHLEYLIARDIVDVYTDENTLMHFRAK